MYIIDDIGENVNEDHENVVVQGNINYQELENLQMLQLSSPHNVYHVIVTMFVT